MNEFHRLLRQWRNEVRMWLKEQEGRRGQKQSRPNHKMCSVCGRFNDANATDCEYCDATLAYRPMGNSAPMQSAASEPINPVMIFFAICAIAFLATVMYSANVQEGGMFASLFNANGAVLATLGSNVGQITLHYGEYWRLVTYMFLHGGAIHIFFNFSAMGQLGTITWGNYGTRRFIALTLATGMAGGLLSALGVFVGLGANSVGISGALFGYLGCNYYFFKHRGHLGVADRFKKFMIWGNIIMIGLTITGLFPIDNLAHLGGMFMGLGLAYAYEHRVLRRFSERFDLLVIALGLSGLLYGLVRIIGDIEANRFTQLLGG